MAVTDTSKIKFQKLEEFSKDLIKETFQEFKNNTPIKSGNARRKTRVTGNKIVADYPYSQKLDQGSSSQAPDGIVKPTLEWLEQRVQQRKRGLRG